jgi:hypothetical protein
VVASPDDLGQAFDQWADVAARSVVAEVSRDRALAYRLESVATQYRMVLEAQACPA